MNKTLIYKEFKINNNLILSINTTKLNEVNRLNFTVYRLINNIKYYKDSKDFYSTLLIDMNKKGYINEINKLITKQLPSVFTKIKKHYKLKKFNYEQI